jgi:hypothetical protein
MGKKKLHVPYDEKFHEKKPYGCIWRHRSGHGPKDDCYYAVNGYDASAGRAGDMYNKHEHRARAREMGYAVDAPAGSKGGDHKVGPAVGQALARKAASKAASFKKAYEKKFGSSLKWLSLDPKGWNYGFTLSKSVPKGWGPQPTFWIKKEKAQGYGAWYPYHHNYHHMIPQGAFHEYVIGKDDKSTERVKAMVMSEWNINKALNVVLLPQETFVARIVGLPAHCPWGVKSHASYSNSLKSKLKQVKAQVDEAADTQACEDAKKAAALLDPISRDILEQIKQMTPGRKLRALR